MFLKMGKKEIEELRTNETKRNASGAGKNGMRANQSSEKPRFFKSDDMSVEIKNPPSKYLHHSL